MRKLFDVRCYVTPEYKRQIKLSAIAENLSVNKWLLKLIDKELQANGNTSDTQLLNHELQHILTQLSNSANMPIQQREQLKKRKKELKELLSILQKGENENG